MLDRTALSHRSDDGLVKLARRFLTFAVIGIVGTLAHYLTLVSLVESAGLRAQAGAMFGFMAGALVNYCLHYRLTFRSNARHRDALSRFLAIAAVGFGLNALLMQWGVESLGIHYLLAQLFATGAVLIWNFAGSMIWAFRESHRER